jgi:hypothetical protein
MHHLLIVGCQGTLECYYLAVTLFTCNFSSGNKRYVFPQAHYIVSLETNVCNFLRSNFI